MSVHSTDRTQRNQAINQEGWVADRLLDAVEAAWEDGATIEEIAYAILGVSDAFVRGELTDGVAPVYADERPKPINGWNMPLNRDESKSDGDDG